MTATAETASELAVTGMTCASCVNHVARALRKIPGVTDATVNLATERAVVAHASNVDDAQLVAALERAGYGATVVTAETPDDDHARARARRSRRATLALGLALTIPTILLAMVVPPFRGSEAIQFALTLPVWAIVGFGFHRGALAALRNGTSTMDTLVSLGSTAAFGYAIVASFTGAPSTYETASAIVTLITLGKTLESEARARSGDAMRALLDLRPQTARVRSADGTTAEIAVDRVRIADIVVVPAGERIAVDGTIVDGASAVDEAMLTGEPIPRDATVGDMVRAGTVNGDGTLVVRTTAAARDTALARIVAIVRAAQGTVPPVQRLADRAASAFVPIILAVAAVTFAAWLLTDHPWSRALAVAVAVLVVACPCALGLATPTAIVVGVGVAARRGILVKDASALERLGSVRDAIFDKTGTLTVGHPEVVHVAPAPGRTTADVLRFAAAIETGSTHPLASAIVRAANTAGLTIPLATQMTAQRGYGVSGIVDGAAIAVSAQLERSTTEPPDTTLVRVVRDGTTLGTIALADAARPEARDAIAALEALGIRVHLASGDADVPVAALAARVGITSWTARQSPEAKAATVRALQTEKRGVLFVGDGINDAPALASADVGIAMGAGSAIALDVAGAALLGNDPRTVADAVRLSRAVTRTIRENLFWAFVYNIALVPLAAFGMVPPILAAAAMGLSSVFVVGNALRLRA